MKTQFRAILKTRLTKTIIIAAVVLAVALNIWFTVNRLNKPAGDSAPDIKKGNTTNTDSNLNYYENGDDLIDPKTPQPSNHEDRQEVPFSLVTLSIQENTLTSGGATFRIDNKSSSDVYYGADYLLQTNNDGKWNDINTRRVFEWILMQFICSRGETRDFDVDWTIFYGNLPDGLYRMVKRIELGSPEEEHNIYCEFTIE